VRASSRLPATELLCLRLPLPRQPLRLGDLLASSHVLGDAVTVVRRGGIALFGGKVEPQMGLNEVPRADTRPVTCDAADAA